MRQREKNSIATKAVAADRARIAKEICPLCRHDISKEGAVHIIQVDDAPTSTGTWVKCLADEVFYKVDHPDEARTVQELKQEMADLKHDVGRAMANHNADLNDDQHR